MTTCPAGEHRLLSLAYITPRIIESGDRGHLTGGSKSQTISAGYSSIWQYPQKRPQKTWAWRIWKGNLSHFEGSYNRHQLDTSARYASKAFLAQIPYMITFGKRKMTPMRASAWEEPISRGSFRPIKRHLGLQFLQQSYHLIINVLNCSMY